MPAPRLQEKYRNEVLDALRQQFGYENVMQVPRLQKIVVNMGLGEATQNQKIIESAVEEMATITGTELTDARVATSEWRGLAGTTTVKSSAHTATQESPNDTPLLKCPGWRNSAAAIP